MKLRMVLIGVLLAAIPAGAEMAVYFAPDGGFARVNRARTIKLPDGRRVAPTLNHAVLDLIARTGSGGQIKLAMYAFSDPAVEQALLDAAFGRAVRVKVILDGVADWTAGNRAAMVTRIKAAQASAPARLRDHFQLAVIPRQGFRTRRRTKRMADGEEICGTMHEKFGVFYDPGRKIPFHAFAGSANLSPAADQSYGENRFVFKDEPAVARQFAEEFARLWNEYGEDALGNAESEPYIPAEPVAAGVRVIFNGEPLDEERYHPIDETLLELLDRVGFRDGTIDIMMFSFTHYQLGQRLLEIARRYPSVRIRLLLDQSQLVPDDEHRGILGPYLENEIKKLQLANFTIKYKWRANSFGWEDPAGAPANDVVAVGGAAEIRADPELDGVPLAVVPSTAPAGAPLVAGAVGSTPVRVARAAGAPGAAGKVTAVHWRSLILHHKVMLVNGRYLAAGSYNWSSSAEKRNLENLLVFDAVYPGQQPIVAAMAAEFETLWRSDFRPGPKSATERGPQVIGGEPGRRLAAIIRQTLQQPHMRPVMTCLDRAAAGKTAAAIAAETGLTRAQVGACLERLRQAGLIYARREGPETIYGLAD